MHEHILTLGLHLQMGLPAQETQYQTQGLCHGQGWCFFSFCCLFLYIHSPTVLCLCRFMFLQVHMNQLYGMWLEAFVSLKPQSTLALKLVVVKYICNARFLWKACNLMSATRILYFHSKLLNKYLSNNSYFPIRSESVAWVRVEKQEWSAGLSSSSLW